MSDQENPERNEVEQLLAEGIAAAKMGDKDSAREKLRRVVELDDHSEKGWFWLASVVETDDERRVCLGNVVVINPNNERAKQLLDKLSSPAAAKSTAPRAKMPAPSKSVDMGQDSMFAKSGPLSQIDPKMLRIGAGVGAGVVVLCLLVFILQGSPPAANLPTVAPDSGGVSTQVVIAPTNANSPTPAISLTPTDVPNAETLMAIAATSGIVQPTLPETWTPIPSPTPRGARPTTTPLASPPPVATGKLIAQLGRSLTIDGNLPLVMINLETKAVIPLTQNERGDFGVLTPDGQRLIYGRFISGTGDMQLRISSITGAGAREISTYWNNRPPLASQRMVSLAPDGYGLVFSAVNAFENDSTADIYFLPINLSPGQATLTPTFTETPIPTLDLTTSPTPTTRSNITPSSTPDNFLDIRRMTERESGINLWPDFSPDGQTIVFISNRSATGEGTDIYAISTAGGQPYAMTTDGDTNIEAAPAWSPDGLKIVYQSKAFGSNTNDIYIMDSNGGNIKPLVSGNGDNIRPLWSPDNQYVAFSSNRTGKFEIFIVEVATGAIFQVTNAAETAIATSWER